MHNLILNNVIIGRSPQEPLRFLFNYTFSSGNLYYIDGINGSGKTTLMRTICGYLSALSGDIILPSICLKPAYYGHQIAIKPKMYVEDYLNFCFSFFYKTSYLKELIEIFDLNALLKIPISYLSYGQKKRVSLVGFLVCNRYVYCFDEASSGLDSHYKAIFYDYLLNQVENDQKIIIVTDHNMLTLKNFIHLKMQDFNEK